MITAEQAFNKLASYNPKLTITKGFDYNKQYYVFLAVQNPNVVDYNDPYYGVNKDTGKVVSFSPGEDLEAFFEAEENRSIDVSQFRHSDQSEYLAHHGIKGQKWYIRRFQNPDGTLTEAGRDRYQKDLAKKFKSDIKDYNSSGNNPKSEVYERSKESEYLRKPKSGTIYEDMHKQLSGARDELRSKTKVLHDFNTNEELVKEYRLKAAKKAFDEQRDDPKSSLEDFEYWYLYDDGDQGSGNSFELYYKDTGKDYNKFISDYYQAHREYEKACKKVTDELLGKYGDEVIRVGPGTDESGAFEKNHKTTLSEEVSKILYDLGEDEVSYIDEYYLPQ